MATFKVLTLALTACVWISVAQAQQSTPQEIPGILLEQQQQAEEQKKRLEQLTTPPAPPAIDKPPRQPAPQGSEATVKVTQFKFSGNTVIETKTLEKIVSPSLGRTLTVRQLNEVAALVTTYYASKGYILSRAYLPPQEIRGGTIQIAVLEGKVGAITVTGNTRYKSSTILRAMGPIRREQVVNEGTLETALNEVNDYPGLRVRADLAPGASVGLSNLFLSAKERLPYTFATDINNYGSRLTGPWLYSGEIGLGNPLGLGDNLTLRGTKSDDNLFFTAVSYLAPITSFGTKVQLSWTHSENVIGGEQAFSLVRPVGRADIASVDLLQTLTRAGALSLLADGGFDFKTIRNIFTIGNPANLQSKDELRIFRLGIRGDYRDQFLGRTYFGLTGHHGVDFWGGSNQNAPQTSFAGAGPGNWSKLTADLARFQSLGFPVLRDLPILPQVFNDSYLILRATGQLASDRLLSPERFSIGGYYSVRGYPVSELIGDNGYAATAELVVPLPSTAKAPFTNLTWKELVQVAAFIDHGGTFATPISIPQGGFGYLTGAGGGLRINLPLGLPEPGDRGTLSLRIDWASAIGRPRPTSRDQGISLNNVYGDGAAGVLYVSAALRL